MVGAAAGVAARQGCWACCHTADCTGPEVGRWERPAGRDHACVAGLPHWSLRQQKWKQQPKHQCSSGSQPADACSTRGWYMWRTGLTCSTHAQPPTTALVPTKLPIQPWRHTPSAAPPAPGHSCKLAYLLALLARRELAGACAYCPETGAAPRLLGGPH